MKQLTIKKIDMGRPFTDKEDEFLKSNYTNIPAKRMAKMLGRSEGTARQRMQKLGLIVPPDIIEKFKRESYIKKGNVPANKGKKQTEYMSDEAIERCKKTMFKKGQIPHNARGFKDGDIVIRHAHKKRNYPPYKWIRIALGKWKMLHVFNWEKANGKIPKKHIVVFKDRDTMNCDISNLEMITLEENMRRNSLHNYPAEIKSTIQLRGALTRKINSKLKNLK